MEYSKTGKSRASVPYMRMMPGAETRERLGGGGLNKSSEKLDLDFPLTPGERVRWDAEKQTTSDDEKLEFAKGQHPDKVSEEFSFKDWLNKLTEH